MLSRRFDSLTTVSAMAILRQAGGLIDRLENEGETRQRLLVLLEGNDDFRPGVPFFCVSDGTSGFSQRIASVDRRGEFFGVDKPTKGGQVVSIYFRNEERELLPQEQRPHECFEQSGKHRPEFLWRSRHDTLPARTQNAPHR